MRSMFTEDFFKNVIGFATVLIVCIAVTAFAGRDGQPQQTHSAQVTATATTQ